MLYSLSGFLKTKNNMWTVTLPDGTKLKTTVFKDAYIIAFYCRGTLKFKAESINDLHFNWREDSL